MEAVNNQIFSIFSNYTKTLNSNVQNNKPFNKKNYINGGIIVGTTVIGTVAGYGSYNTDKVELKSALSKAESEAVKTKAEFESISTKILNEIPKLHTEAESISKNKPIIKPWIN